MASYVNAVRAIVCFELPDREASNFCDFWKFTSCDFIAFISFLIEVNFCFWDVLIKGELRNNFNLISEERVTFYEQNSENLVKIGWKIRKLWHFEVSQIFTKQFLTSRYEYANERVDDVIASLLAIYFVHKI